MAAFVKGDVVVVPFSLLRFITSKRRPALVLADLPGEDVILCQITSQHVRGDYAIALSQQDFDTGQLNVQSNVRPNRIFTADKNRRYPIDLKQVQWLGQHAWKEAAYRSRRDHLLVANAQSPLSLVP